MERPINFRRYYLPICCGEVCETIPIIDHRDNCGRHTCSRGEKFPKLKKRIKKY